MVRPMTSIVVNSFGGPEVLELVERPLPDPGPGQVRVRVEAAGVHPVDLFVRSGPPAGFLADRVQPPYILGWDLAGAVDAVGDGVTGFRPGDRVIGLTSWKRTGAGSYTDYAVFDASWLAPAPTSVSAAEAATIPLNALTAAQAVDRLDVAPGTTIVVTGAAGSLGGFAVELAVARGFRVLAVAARADESVVRTFGAELFVTRSDDVAQAVRAMLPAGADGLVDAAVIGPPAIGAVRDGGRFVAVTAHAPAPERGVNVTVIDVQPDGPRLAELSAAVDAGTITPRLVATYPFAQVAEAHRRQAKGGIRGRLVLVP